jgi:hypothetical protein
MTEHHQQRSDPRIAERAIIWQLLRDDHDERWSLIEFRVEIDHVEPSALSNALERLERHGVAVAWGDWVLASRCARHLDELGLVSV